MDRNNYKHIILFSILVGSLIYFFNVIWSAIFIVAVPMDKDWCKNSMQYETSENQIEWVCTEFKNELEEHKYYHNSNMQERNQYWLYAMLAFGGCLGFLAFCKMPKWRGKKEVSRDISGPIILGIVVAFLVPLIYGWILPTPKNGFLLNSIKFLRRDRKQLLKS